MTIDFGVLAGACVFAFAVGTFFGVAVGLMTTSGARDELEHCRNEVNGLTTALHAYQDSENKNAKLLADARVEIAHLNAIITGARKWLGCQS